MKTYSQWKNEIDKQIASQKEKHHKVRIYHVAAEMSNETAHALREYFSKEYEVELTRCNSCLTSKWDIMVSWG